MTDSRREKQLSDFIDDLNKERKPRAYQNSHLEEETEKLFETVRAVRRTHRGGEEERPGEINPREQQEKTPRDKDLKRASRSLPPPFKKAALVAGAALLIFAAFLGVMEIDYLFQDNLVHAVVRAYEDLDSYRGTAEIRSRRNGEIDYRETIEITYQKPWRYKAVHQYDGTRVKNISDGERLVSVYPHDITVDNVFPEKELWRYHLGAQVWELQGAKEVRELGEETLLGRQALVVEYRYTDYYHRMWIDKETHLPLRRELTHQEGDSSLVVEFKDIEINPTLDPELFVHDGGVAREDTMILEQDQEYEEINRRGSLEEVKTPLDLEALQASLPSPYQLFTVGVLEDNPFFDYVLRYKGEREMDFLDIYLSSRPQELAFYSDSRVGELGEGYVEVNRGARNVMDLYVGERSIARWLTPSFEVFMVARQGSPLPLEILEKVSGEKMEESSLLQLKKEGINLPTDKN